MFDRTQPSKRAKTWRADPGLLSNNSSRGFASTRWGEGDDGFMVDDIKRTKDGFALDEYAQVPLSPQAIRALKQLQAMEPDENDGIYIDDIEAPEKFQIETWNANAHLPFVVDAYEFGDELTDNLAAEPAVLPDVQNVEVTQTETHSVAAISETISDPISEPMSEPMSEPVQDAVAETAADAEATQAIDATEQTQTQTQTQAQAQAHTDEPVDVEAPTSSDAQTPLDAQADTTTEAEAVTTEEETPTEEEKPDAPVHALAEPEPTAETKVAAESPAETDMVESDLNDENTIAPEQMAASLEEVVEDITLPEPVLAGIDPEVAEQREAEKFAEGLAQGIEQGERQAREAMQQEVQAQCTVMANVTQELHALLQDSKAFYEPLKRLSLHLAEQIVMGELRTSTHAVEKLVQRCLDELDHPAQGLVVLELNPEDKTRLQAQSPELIQGMRLEAVQDMQPGSVRLFANDTVVEDLVEHRLEALAQSMLVDVATWKAQSALAKPDASTQDLESEDVHP